MKKTILIISLIFLSSTLYSNSFKNTSNFKLKDYISISVEIVDKISDIFKNNLISYKYIKKKNSLYKIGIYCDSLKIADSLSKKIINLLNEKKVYGTFELIIIYKYTEKILLKKEIEIKYEK